MVYDSPISTKISGPVARRLRLLAALRDQAMNHLLDSLLDKELPSVTELASQMASLGDGEANPPAEVAA